MNKNIWIHFIDHTNVLISLENISVNCLVIQLLFNYTLTFHSSEELDCTCGQYGGQDTIQFFI